MNPILSIILASLLAVSATAQVQQPKTPIKPPTPAKAFKAMAPVTVKACEHIVIDASSASGKIEFLYDTSAFPKERATLTGKILVLSTPTNGVYTIAVVSYDDGMTERIVVKVTDGTDSEPDPDPKPKPKPPPADPLEVLRGEMKAAFAKMAAEQAALTVRVAALEKGKPKPDPDPPKPGAVKHVTFITNGTLLTDRIVNDADLIKKVNESGMTFNILPLKIRGKDNPQIHKLGMFAYAGSAPIIILQNEVLQDGRIVGNVIATAPMTTAAAAWAFIQEHRGK